MKKGIHPNWNHQCAVTCSCGNTFITGSGSKTMEIDICEKCHPFFTGEMRFVDRQGRVDKFLKKVQKAKAKQASSTKKSKAKKNQADPQSYQDILRNQQSAMRKVSKSTKTDANAKAAATATKAKPAKVTAGAA